MMKINGAVTLALCLAAAGCQPGQKAPAAEPENSVETVHTAVAAPHDTPLDFVARGTLQPSPRAQITAAVAGHLLQLRLQPGLRVRRGEVLARLDPVPHRLRRARAVAEMARSASARAQALRRHQRRQLARHKNASLITQEAWEQVLAELRAAQAQHAVARAELAQASWALAQTQVRAPCAGVIAAVTGELGSFLQQGSALGALTRDAAATVRFFVPAQIARALAPGQKLKVVDDLKSCSSGQITHVAADADIASKQVEILARLETRLAAFPHDHVTVHLAAPADAGAMQLPPAALVERDTGRGVFVVDAADTLQFRAVEPQVIGADAVVVRGDLRPGETVVIAAADRLQTGMRVRPVAAATAP